MLNLDYSFKYDGLKYAGYDIVFQEVPDEISLAINVTNCPHHCAGCHSEYLALDFGNYISNDIESMLDKHKDLITCVCFMGGDQNIIDLIDLLRYVKSKNLKTCVYSGADDVHIFDEVFNLLDYLKIGHYDSSLGGLSSKNTNQKFYKIEHDNQGKSKLILMNERFVK